MNDPEVKDVKNNRNTITKRDYNVGKNIRVHCCKNITPKQGQNVSKMSIANKNINIARGKVISDTKNHYSRSKVIEKPQITMAKDPDTINGQRYESENNSHALGNGIVQRCDSADNRRSRTSKHGDKTQGQANYTPSVKNKFWPLCTQESVNHSSHGHDYTLSPDVSDTKGDRKVSEPVKEVNKCQATVSKDTIKISNNIDKNLAILAPTNKSMQLVHQIDQANNNMSDPDKYALDLRFHPCHRLRIQEAKNCRVFKLWDDQMSDKFGFIPLQDQIIPRQNHKNPSMSDVLKMHEIIRNSDTCNFLDCQIQVPSQLNADV